MFAGLGAFVTVATRRWPEQPDGRGDLLDRDIGIGLAGGLARQSQFLRERRLDKALDIGHARLPAEAPGVRCRTAEPADDLVRARRRQRRLLQRDAVEEPQAEQGRRLAP